MAKRKFQLTSEEVERLAKAERDSCDGHKRRRLQAVRLYGSGHAQSSICELVGCGERSVRKWANQYRRGSSIAPVPMPKR